MSESQNKTPEEKWVSLLNVLELFRRYFSNEASARERNSIDTWEPIENEKELLSDKTLEKECDTVLVWNAVSKDLNFNISPGQKRFHIRFLHRYAAAAVLFILLGGGILFLNQHNSFNRSEYGTMADANTFFQTTDGQTKQITLPDGSRIHLNRGTKISYASNAFNLKLREVWLSGEAFFDVAKNADKPFIIHTGDMTTTVRGTSFNVKVYPQLGENVVSVRTGKVQISQQGKQLAMLTPNEQIIYNTLNNQYETGVADGENAAGWRNGRLIFNSANIEELKLRLKQQYHVDLVIQDKALKDIMLNSSFAKGTSLNEVMNTIADFYNVKYNITSSGQVILSE